MDNNSSNNNNDNNNNNSNTRAIFIRSAPSDPMRQVLFEKGTLIPRLEFRKRPGKPRQQWLTTTYDDAYQTLNQPHPFDIDNPAHRQLVNDLACQRIGVFSWSITENRHRNHHLKLWQIITENRHRKSSPKAKGFLPALPISQWVLGLLLSHPWHLWVVSNFMFVSYTNVFDMALQGRDQFHPPGTVFMHDYVGFCAQPVWPALGKKKKINTLSLDVPFIHVLRA